MVDDGSSDRTPEIADRLEREHPGIVRAIHQPNKGHGGAVNTGIENATGRYFKVVDSDDKVDPRFCEEAYRHVTEGNCDMAIFDFQQVTDKENGWTIRTKDHKLSAQIEYMVLITDDGAEVLTK